MIGKYEFEDEDVVYTETFRVVDIWHAETGELLSETWENDKGVRLKTCDRPIHIDHEGTGQLLPVDTETYIVEIVRFCDSHLMESQTWYDEETRKKHRTHDLPAVIEYETDMGMSPNDVEVPSEYSYFFYGIESGELGPSEMSLNRDGILHIEIWKRDGKYRTDRACYISRDGSGMVRERAYSRDGEKTIVSIEPNAPEPRKP